MSDAQRLDLVATCGLGLEDLVLAELAELGIGEAKAERAAVTFRGDWRDVWRSNWRLTVANRVLVRLAGWEAPDGDSLAAGAQALVADRSRSWGGVSSERLFAPRRTLAIRATSNSSQVRDTRWVALRVKDGLVDAQRLRFRRRSSVDRRDPDLPLRVWLYRDRATLLLDTSGASLDHRGYRLETAAAPVREHIAAACVRASGWDGRGPVVDPMCGAGTLLAEAARFALGRAAGELRERWSFERLPGFDAAAFGAIRREPIPAPGPGVELYGVDASATAVEAARTNLKRARLDDRARLQRGDGFEFEPPAETGLVVLNPPFGERLEAGRDQWRRVGDLFKQRYKGWRAVVLAGDADRGKHIGLKPSFRRPLRHGPLDARILGFDIY